MSRRALLRVIIAGGALAATSAVLGCGTSPGRGGAAGKAPAGTLIMVIRHAEKVRSSSPLPGIDETGKPDPSSLTPVGWDRARRLVDIFGGAQGSARPGLARPRALYAAVGSDEPADATRTRETVEPLADRLGLQIDTSFGTGDEGKLVDYVTAAPGPTLICWHHDEIITIAEAFGSVTPTPPRGWPDDRFDLVWTFTKSAGEGWRFDQIPEHVLPEDQLAVITN
jgi:hypothetical protein